MQKKNLGFTLVELMTVIVIVGILAAAAMPLYKSYTFKAKMAEVNVLFDSIKKTNIQHYNDEKYFLYGIAGGEGQALIDIATGSKITLEDYGWILTNSDSSKQLLTGIEHLPINFYINVGAGGGTDQNNVPYGYGLSDRIIYEEGVNGTACDDNPIRTNAAAQDFGVPSSLDASEDWFMIPAKMNMAAPGQTTCALFGQTFYTSGNEVITNPVIQFLQ